MKRSGHITLLVIGTLGLMACSSDADTLRQGQYQTLADCQDDWGTEPRNCQPARTSGASHLTSTYFGPRYYWDRDARAPIAVDDDGNRRLVSQSRLTAGSSGKAISTTTMSAAHAGSATRGGFGSSSRSSSGGG